MTQQMIIDYWMEKARADLESARDNFNSGRLSNAIRDACFACFHALSSVLFKEGKTFRKHREARSACTATTSETIGSIPHGGSTTTGFSTTGKRRTTAPWFSSNLTK